MEAKKSKYVKEEGLIQCPNAAEDWELTTAFSKVKVMGNLDKSSFGGIAGEKA